VTVRALEICQVRSDERIIKNLLFPAVKIGHENSVKFLILTQRIIMTGQHSNKLYRIAIKVLLISSLKWASSDRTLPLLRVTSRMS
jgi:hypothetical protein